MGHSSGIGFDLVAMLKLQTLLLTWISNKADFVTWHNHARKVWDHQNRPLTPAELRAIEGAKLWKELTGRSS